MTFAGPPPLIAVTADVYVEDDGDRVQQADETYLRALARGAGTIPLIVPSLPEPLDAAAIVDRVDGLLVTGAKSNVHPSLYGQGEHDRSGPFDRDRDTTSLALIQAALARDLPILAICRGIQELNVAMGGSLASEIQDKPGRMDHRAPAVTGNDNRFAIRQAVDVAAGGCLATIVGAGPLQVNSLHRQGIDRLAPGLAVEATAPDGTIEAVRIEGASFGLAVQWHPEYWVASDPASGRIFAAFGQAVRDRMRRRSLPVAAE